MKSFSTIISLIISYNLVGQFFPPPNFEYRMDCPPYEPPLVCDGGACVRDYYSFGCSISEENFLSISVIGNYNDYFDEYNNIGRLQVNIEGFHDDYVGGSRHAYLYFPNIGSIRSIDVGIDLNCLNFSGCSQFSVKPYTWPGNSTDDCEIFYLESKEIGKVEEEVDSLIAIIPDHQSTCLAIDSLRNSIPYYENFEINEAFKLRDNWQIIEAEEFGFSNNALFNNSVNQGYREIQHTATATANFSVSVMDNPPIVTFKSKHDLSADAFYLTTWNVWPPDTLISIENSSHNEYTVYSAICNSCVGKFESVFKFIFFDTNGNNSDEYIFIDDLFIVDDSSAITLADTVEYSFNRNQSEELEINLDSIFIDPFGSTLSYSIDSKQKNLSAHIKNGRLYVRDLKQSSIFVNITAVNNFQRSTNGTLLIRNEFLPLLYPNPASDIIHIDYKEFKKGYIFDTFGKMHLQFEGSDVDVSTLSKGLYLIILDDLSKKHTLKLIKE